MKEEKVNCKFKNFEVKIARHHPKRLPQSGTSFALYKRYLSHIFKVNTVKISNIILIFVIN